MYYVVIHSIQDPAYRYHGSSNGFFGGQQFFTCKENCGLFVSLDRLSPMDNQVNQQETPQQHQNARGYQMVHVSRSQAQAQQSNLDQQSPRNHNPSQQNRRVHSPNHHNSKFRLEDRVVVYNKKGIGIHGSVRWIEYVMYGGQPLLAIGIETVILLYLTVARNVLYIL